MARTVAGATPGRTNRKFLIVALLFGAVTAALFYAVTARGGSSDSTNKAVAGDTPVVVAKVPIQQRTTITLDMLEVKSIPASTVIGGAYTNIGDAVGKVTKFPIEVNQQVVASSVVDLTKPASGAELALVVPTGKRAMSVKASQVFAAGGLILPGDYVDMIWICCSDGQPVISKTLLRNVQVAAVAQNIVDSGPVNPAPTADAAAATGDAPAPATAGAATPDAVTLTLLLTPQEAQLVFLAEASGSFRASLRGVGDQDTPDSGVTLFSPNIVSQEDLNGLPDALKPDFLKQAP